MCLIRKEGYNFDIVKDKPIEAYKVLIEEDGDLVSPVMGFRYQIGKTYEEMLGGISICTVGGFPIYDIGFHMLSSIDGAELYLAHIEKYVSLYNEFTDRKHPTFLVIAKCLIPIADMVNTIYVTGEDMDAHIPCVVSNRMQITGIVSKTPIEHRRKAPNLKEF